MRLKLLMLMAVLAALLIAGCASKGYVDQQVTAAKADLQSDIDKNQAQSEMNAGEITKLQTLAAEISGKADMALNEAKGFENYQVIWEGSVLFDYDSDALAQFEKDKLEDLGQKMIDYPKSLLEVAGHTDKSGTAKYNYELGMKRSDSVKRYLVDQYGVALYRMFTVSHGEDKPVSMPDEKDANSKNRRVVLKLWGNL